MIGLLFITTPSYGNIEVGTGLSSATGGRTVPTLALGVHLSNWTASGFATGVQSEYYYHSAYAAHLFRTWKSGTFLGGNVESGFGGGLYYSQRAYQASNETVETTSSDFVFGPAYRLHLVYWDHVYINMDAIFGLRDFSLHTALTFQDVISLSLGVTF